MFNFDPARDVPTTLREFGQAYIALLCRPGGGSAIRTVMAIAERMPDVGRRYYERVLDKTINRLADYLDAHVDAGELAIDDCHLAASQFMLMCQASLFLPFVFQAAPPPSPERVRGRHRQRDTDVSGRVSGEGGFDDAARHCEPTRRIRRVGKAKRAHHPSSDSERWWARACAPLPTLIWGLVSQGCPIGSVSWAGEKRGRRAKPRAA